MTSNMLSYIRCLIRLHGQRAKSDDLETPEEEAILDEMDNHDLTEEEEAEVSIISTEVKNILEALK